MKIVDAASLKTKRQVQAAWAYCLASARKTRRGVEWLEPVKWLFPKDPGKVPGLQKAQIMIGDSLIGTLEGMVNRIDEVATQHGMAVTKKFRAKRNPVIVVTSRNAEDVEALNAMPIPPEVVEVQMGGVKSGD